MSFDAQVHIGTAAIIVSHFRLLMVQRGPDVSHGADHWSVPGGWINYCETPEQAVVREVLEETGISVKVTARLGYVTNVWPEPIDHVLCMFFQCQPVRRAGEIRNMEPDKHSRVEWVPFRDIPNLDLFAPLESYFMKIGWA